MLLDKNAKITVGGAIVIASALFTAAWQLRELQISVRQMQATVWTVEDQQNWADTARRLNPSIVVPNPYEVRRMKKVELMGKVKA